MIETPLGPTSHYFYSMRLKLHYVDWGNHEKPPLLLIHGGRDHARNWDWVAQDLRRDYHIIAPDLRGHGDSQWDRRGLLDGRLHARRRTAARRVETLPDHDHRPLPRRLDRAAVHRHLSRPREEGGGARRPRSAAADD